MQISSKYASTHGRVLGRRAFVRRMGAGATALASGLVTTEAALAQGYPDRVVEVVIAFAPGGSSDLSVRPVTDNLSQMMGNRFVVMNKPGAAGSIGTMQVVRSAADGYTLLHGYVGNIGINPGLYGAKLPYDPTKDLVAVASLTSLPLFLVVHPSVPVKSVPELVAYAKSHPGDLTFGSSGNGSSNHLVGEKFKAEAGIDMRHIPYSGSGQSSIELLGGHINLSFDAGLVVQYIKNGRLRGLAVTSANRLPELPDLPAMSEYYPGFEATSWHGLFAPAATPAAIVEILNRNINEILARPEIARIYAQSFIYPFPMTSEKYGRFVREEIGKWTAVVKASGTQIE